MNLTVRKMHVFIGDYFIYLFDFKTKLKKAIYTNRINPIEEIVLKKQFIEKEDL